MKPQRVGHNLMTKQQQSGINGERNLKQRGKRGYELDDRKVRGFSSTFYIPRDKACGHL